MLCRIKIPDLREFILGAYQIELEKYSKVSCRRRLRTLCRVEISMTTENNLGAYQIELEKYSKL
jgi:hypothetical protein